MNRPIVIPPVTEKGWKRLREVITHEAGHYAVAKALKFEVKGVEIHRGTGRLEGDQFHGSANSITVLERGLRTLEEMEDHILRRIPVLHAGAFAEAFDGENFDERLITALRKSSASSDIGRAKELFTIYLNLRTSKGIDLEFARESYKIWTDHNVWLELEDLAKKLVVENWQAIERIACEMVKRFENCQFRAYNDAATSEMLDRIGWGTTVHDS